MISSPLVMSRMAITTSRTWLPQWTSRMRQLGDGGKELAVGAGAEAVGAAGAVDAGVRDGAWAEAAVAGAGAGTGVGVGAEDEAGAGAGVEAEQGPVLDPEEALPWACSDGPQLRGADSVLQKGPSAVSLLFSAASLRSPGLKLCSGTLSSSVCVTKTFTGVPFLFLPQPRPRSGGAGLMPSPLLSRLCVSR